MKLLPFTLGFLFLALATHAQYSKWEPTNTYWGYRTAFTFSNPLGAAAKVGGGVEHRLGNFSYMASYYIYNGAYPGAMTDLDLRKYVRKHYQHTEFRNWQYQDFVYMRGFYGLAAFDGDRMLLFDYPKNIYWDYLLYYGASAGYGRRYSNKAFFITVKAGLRGTAIYDLEEQAKHLYRLFYFTGPGSIFELNFQTGFQI